MVNSGRRVDIVRDTFATATLLLRLLVKLLATELHPVSVMKACRAAHHGSFGFALSIGIMITGVVGLGIDEFIDSRLAEIFGALWE